MRCRSHEPEATLQCLWPLFVTDASVKRALQKSSMFAMLGLAPNSASPAEALDLRKGRTTAPHTQAALPTARHRRRVKDRPPSWEAVAAVFTRSHIGQSASDGARPHEDRGISGQSKALPEAAIGVHGQRQRITRASGQRLQMRPSALPMHQVSGARARRGAVRWHSSRALHSDAAQCHRWVRWAHALSHTLPKGACKCEYCLPTMRRACASQDNLLKPGMLTMSLRVGVRLACAVEQAGCLDWMSTKGFHPRPAGSPVNKNRGRMWSIKARS